MTAIEEVRAALPAAAPWMDGVTWFAVAFVLAAICGSIGVRFALKPLRRAAAEARGRTAAAAPGAAPEVAATGSAAAEATATAEMGAPAGGLHWAERARLSYPARRGALRLAWLSVVIVLLPALLSLRGLASAVPAGVVWLAAAAGATAGLLVPARWVSGAARGMAAPRWPVALRDALVFYAIVRAAHIVLLALLLVMIDLTGRAAVLALAIAAIVLACLVVWSGLPLLRLLGIARPAGERVRAVVAERAAAMGFATPPRCWEVSWSAANAFALVFCKQLLFSSRLLELIDDQELGAIAAHELEHLREPLRARLGGVAALALALGLAAMVPLARDLGPLVIAAGVGILVVVGLLVRRVSWRLEVQADRAAAAAVVDPGPYACGLTKGYSANLTPAVLGGRWMTHPELYDRLTALGGTPDFPRPAPPGRGRLAGAFVLELAAAIGLAALLLAGVPAAARASLGAEKGALMMATLTGGDAVSLAALADRWTSQGLVSRTLAFARVQAAAFPQDVRRQCYLAEILAWSGDCSAAWQAVEHADALRHPAEESLSVQSANMSAMAHASNFIQQSRHGCRTGPQDN